MKTMKNETRDRQGEMAKDREGMSTVNDSQYATADLIST